MKEQASQMLNLITSYKTLLAALIASFLALAGIGHVAGGSNFLHLCSTTQPDLIAKPSRAGLNTTPITGNNDTAIRF